jgi:hypothetical protein
MKKPAKGFRRDGRKIDDIALAVCAHMRGPDKLSLRKACQREDVPPSRLCAWLDQNQELAEHYARARDELIAWHDQEIEDIADSVELDAENAAVTQAAVAVAKLRIDTRKWLRGKQLPRRYGDRQTLAGDPDAPLGVVLAKPVKQLTPDEWAASHGEE